MKVRIGIGTATARLHPAALGGLAAAIVELGFDSLWLPEILTAPTDDPLVALAWVGAEVPACKLGTTMLLPGRHLVRLAKQIATLDRLSGGRLLVTFVPGLARGAERHAVGVPPARRGEWMDDGLAVVRRLLSGETVTHEGPAGRIDRVAISPGPLQDPFDIWVGGNGPAAQERCGRLADGWLPSMCTPAEAAAGREVVERAAGRAGRTISPEHFGVSLAYSAGPLDPAGAATLAAMARERDLSGRVALDLGVLRSLLEQYLACGFSKFVLRPLSPPADWPAELATLAEAVGDLQT